MSLTIDGQANSIASSVGGVNIPATVGTLSVGPSGSYMNVTSSGIAATSITATNITTTQVLNNAGRPILNQSGSILQVVQTVKTDGYGQNGNAWTDIPGMSLTITPSSSSSKVLIECRIGIVSLNGTYSSAFRLYRGATLIGGGDVVNSSESVFFRSSQMVNSDHGASDGMTYLDSPATTSATTYKIQMKVQAGAGCYINRDYTGNNNADVYGSRTISTLTALEVSV